MIFPWRSLGATVAPGRPMAESRERVARRHLLGTLEGNDVDDSIVEGTGNPTASPDIHITLLADATRQHRFDCLRDTRRWETWLAAGTLGRCRHVAVVPKLWPGPNRADGCSTISSPPGIPPSHGRQALGCGFWPMAVLLSSHGYFHPHPEWRAEHCALIGTMAMACAARPNLSSRWHRSVPFSDCLPVIHSCFGSA